MTFPTIPTVAGGRVLPAVQANTTATRTFPDLSGLTNNAGDLLMAIIVAYQDGTGAAAAFSGWTGGFTEFHDSAGSSLVAIGAAYKWSTGSETGTFAVTQATVTGHAAMIVMAIPGAHATTPPEAGGRASSTNSNADAGSFGPVSWGTDDTLWITVAGVGETSLAGAFQGIIAGPTSYTEVAVTGPSDDAIGAIEGGAAFQQLAADTEDPAAYNTDVSNARWGAITIAVRPVAAAPPDTLPRPPVVGPSAAVHRASSW